ncbi:MAG TPA: hypothetical protein VNO55_06490, partial [Polyangia bacterium]|nr:hypothetical protein [Polyangia bacterium]
MTRKRPAGPADRDRAEGAAEDSVENSLNQILAEADPAATVIPGTEASTDPSASGPAETAETAETAEAPAAPGEAEAASAETAAAPGEAASAPAVEAAEPQSASASEIASEAAAEVDVEVDVDADAEVEAAIESVSLAIDEDDDAVPARRTPSELASMSGPALVDDVREEQTDVETPEAMAAAAAAAERALASGEAASDQVGTPVRVDSADLARASMVSADEITATGGGTRESGDVITAENLEYFTSPKDA